MAKRFTDTDKWKRGFFNNLTNDARLLWIYLLDNCDSTGIWHIDYRLASFQLGFSVNQKFIEKHLLDKVVFVENDKLFIPSFIDFQYGELSPSNNAHKPVLKLLQKMEKSSPPISPSSAPLRGAQDKDKDKDKDKDNIIIADSDFDYTHPIDLPVSKYVPDLEKLYALYPKKEGKKEGIKRLSKIIDTEKKYLEVEQAIKNYVYMHGTKEKQFQKMFSSFVSVWEDYKTVEEKTFDEYSNEEIGDYFDALAAE